MQVSPPLCFMLVLECLRLSIILTTVLHLLLMVTLHTAAICCPVKMKNLMTNKIILIQITVLWLLPLLTIFSSFSSLPSQLFRSSSCSDYSLLQSLQFRAVFTSAIFLPVAIIILTYAYFYFILSRRLR